MESFLQNNWVDLLFIAIILAFAASARGLLSTTIEILSFIFSLLFSYRFYSFFGILLTKYFSTPTGIANAAGFFIAWSVMEAILYILIFYLSHKYLASLHQHPVNQRLGFIAGIFQGAFIFLFLTSIIFALPVRGNIKNDILESRTGPFFVNISQSLQLKSKNVFGGAVTEALNFLTVKPQSNESIALDFKLKPARLSVDLQSELQLLELVNKERAKVGLNRLQMDESLQQLARSYAEEMFVNGFFSHISQVDGSTPGDRADRMGVQYLILGENLAFAPDVYLAHQGLMNSEGHRENILGVDYGKVGMGVINGGVYGKMFVQEFSD